MPLPQTLQDDLKEDCLRAANAEIGRESREATRCTGTEERDCRNQQKCRLKPHAECLADGPSIPLRDTRIAGMPHLLNEKSSPRGLEACNFCATVVTVVLWLLAALRAVTRAAGRHRIRRAHHLVARNKSRSGMRRENSGRTASRAHSENESSNGEFHDSLTPQKW